MKLKSVSFPTDSTPFRCGGDSRNTWHAEQHAVEIWIEGDWCWVQKGESKAFAHKTRIAHAVPLEEVKAKK